MKRLFAFAGALALAVTPAASFADHLEPKESEIRPSGNLVHTNMRNMNLNGRDLSGANLRLAHLIRANLSHANLSGVRATNLRGCPSFLPNGWVCENNSLIQR